MRKAKFWQDHVFVTREVDIHIYPRQDRDAIMDLLCDTFLDKFSIVGSGKNLELGGWPWYIPKFIACRRVAKVLNDAGYWADVQYRVVYCSYIGPKKDDENE